MAVVSGKQASLWAVQPQCGVGFTSVTEVTPATATAVLRIVFVSHLKTFENGQLVFKKCHEFRAFYCPKSDTLAY